MRDPSSDCFNPWNPRGGKDSLMMDPPAMDPSLSPRGSLQHQAEEWAESNGGEHKYGGQGFNFESAASGKWGPSNF